MLEESRELEMVEHSRRVLNEKYRVLQENRQRADDKHHRQLREKTQELLFATQRIDDLEHEVSRLRDELNGLFRNVQQQQHNNSTSAAPSSIGRVAASSSTIGATTNVAMMAVDTTVIDETTTDTAAGVAATGTQTSVQRQVQHDDTANAPPLPPREGDKKRSPSPPWVEAMRGGATSVPPSQQPFTQQGRHHENTQTEQDTQLLSEARRRDGHRYTSPDRHQYDDGSLPLSNRSRRGSATVVDHQYGSRDNSPSRRRHRQHDSIVEKAQGAMRRVIENTAITSHCTKTATTATETAAHEIRELRIREEEETLIELQEEVLRRGKQVESRETRLLKKEESLLQRESNCSAQEQAIETTKLTLARERELFEEERKRTLRAIEEGQQKLLRGRGELRKARAKFDLDVKEFEQRQEISRHSAEDFFALVNKRQQSCSALFRRVVQTERTHADMVQTTADEQRNWSEKQKRFVRQQMEGVEREREIITREKETLEVERMRHKRSVEVTKQRLRASRNSNIAALQRMQTTLERIADHSRSPIRGHKKETDDVKGATTTTGAPRLSSPFRPPPTLHEIDGVALSSVSIDDDRQSQDTGAPSSVAAAPHDTLSVTDAPPPRTHKDPYNRHVSKRTAFEFVPPSMTTEEDAAPTPHRQRLSQHGDLTSLLKTPQSSLQKRNPTVASSQHSDAGSGRVIVSPFRSPKEKGDTEEMSSDTHMPSSEYFRRNEDQPLAARAVNDATTGASHLSGGASARRSHPIDTATNPYMSGASNDEEEDEELQSASEKEVATALAF